MDAGLCKRGWGCMEKAFSEYLNVASLLGEGLLQ